MLFGSTYFFQKHPDELMHFSITDFDFFLSVWLSITTDEFHIIDSAEKVLVFFNETIKIF